jgi:tRNA uridine 5-carbamoylmethylation protein Kti12
MATAIERTRCVTCGKEKATLKCAGCSQDFCFDHVTDHRQELSKQLDEVEVNRDLFRQTLTEQTVKPEEHPLMKQINAWEHDSINKIRQTAEDTRQIIFTHITEYIKQLEVKLRILTDQLRRARQENDFFEMDLRQWNEQLTQLKKELNGP